MLNEAVAQVGLHEAGSPAVAPAAGDDVAALWERLHDRQRPLTDDEGRRWTPVFVVDQFEEIFTLQLDEERRLLAFQQLGDLLENRVPPAVASRLDQHEDLIDRLDLDSQPYRFLVSLREDFLPELESWADLIPRLGPNRYRLLPMSREQAWEAVQKTGGTLVDAQSAPRIVEFLGRQAASRAGSVRTARDQRRIDPALLSLVCASLHADRLAPHPPGTPLDVADLENRGAQILDRFYDAALADLPEDLRAPAAHWIETNLITTGGARRPYPLAAVDAALLRALRHLVDRRLMRIENTEQGDQVELVHDRLAAVALQRAQMSQRRAEEAERLRLDKAAAELEVLKQRARMAEIAEDRAHDAQRASRRALRLTAALAVVAGLALAAAYLAWNQRAGAEAATTAAREATGEAEYKAAAAQQALNAFTGGALCGGQGEAGRHHGARQDQRRAGASGGAAVGCESLVSERRERGSTIEGLPCGQAHSPIGRPADRAAAQSLLAGAARCRLHRPASGGRFAETVPQSSVVRYFRRGVRAGRRGGSRGRAPVLLPGVTAEFAPAPRTHATVPATTSCGWRSALANAKHAWSRKGRVAGAGRVSRARPGLHGGQKR